MNTNQERETLETQLFNKVLLNRIEQKRDELKRVKAENYELKQLLKEQSGTQLIKEISAFIGIFAIGIFLLFAVLKAFL
tara:strand:+ start:118 stop:354 length:237 start_codon:yes stop_codon:yes gene_type:complete